LSPDNHIAVVIIISAIKFLKNSILKGVISVTVLEVIILILISIIL